MEDKIKPRAARSVTFRLREVLGVEGGEAKSFLEEPLLEEQEIKKPVPKKIPSQTAPEMVSEDVVYSDDDEGEQRHMQAAVLMGVALQGRVVPQRIDTILRQKLYQFYYHPTAQTFMMIVVLILMALALVEAPSTMVMPMWFTMLVEFVCLCFLSVEHWVRYQFLGPKQFKQSRWNTAKLIALGFSFFNIVLYVIMAAAGFQLQLRLSRFCRAFFLAERKRSRQICDNLLKTIPQIMDIFCLVAFTVLVYSVICRLYFLGQEEGQIYFDSFMNGYFAMFILMTTANFPDVMLPGYRDSKLNFLIFFTFLVIALIILFNLATAVIYNIYRIHLKAQVKLENDETRKGLRDAFRILDHGNQGFITYEQWLKAVKIVKPASDPDKYKIIFNMLDTDGSGKLSIEEFMDFAWVCRLGYKKKMKSGSKIKRTVSIKRTISGMGARLESTFTHRSTWKRIVSATRSVSKVIVEHKFFDWFINSIIFCTILIVLAEALQDRREKNSVQDQLEGVDIAFIVVFFVEMVMKIVAWGPNKYWRSAWNRFDAFIVIISTVCTALVQSNVQFGDNEAATKRFMSLVLLVRVFRLFRLIGHIKRFRVIITTFANLAPGLVPFLGVIVVAYYEFAMIGIEAFGYPNILTPENLAGCNCAFVSSDYFANNFSSLLAAMVTLFELMVVNNWFMIMDGVAYASESGWSRLYFVAWYLLSVVIFLNLFVAYILEAYVSGSDSAAKGRKNARKLEIERKMSRALVQTFGSNYEKRNSTWRAREKSSVQQVFQDLFLQEILDEEAQEQRKMEEENRKNRTNSNLTVTAWYTERQKNM